jgi:hypothetical protein
MERGRATQFTTAGGAQALGLGDGPRTFVVTPAAAAVVVSIKEGGTGGPVVLTLQAAANGASVVVGPFQIRDPFLSAISGAGGFLTVIQ